MTTILLALGAVVAYKASAYADDGKTYLLVVAGACAVLALGRFLRRVG